MEIIKVPFVNSMDESGCELAPDLILEELRKIHYNEKGKVINHAELRINEIEINKKNISESSFNILRDSREIIERNFKCVFIGGDHSITYLIAKSFSKTQENPLLIVFDANANSEVADKNPMNNQWIRQLLEGNYLPHQILLVSTRNYSFDELEYLKKKRVLVISMDVLQEDIENVCDLIMERARNSSGFYLSIDINCLDPAFAPGVNNPAPAGLSSRELVYILKRLFLLNNLKILDITEINPKKDINDITVKLGAKILSEVLC